MAIEHVNIPDAGRHEPKGASTAPENFLIVSNGDGTTQWKSAAEVVDPSSFIIETVLGSASSAVDQIPGAVDTPLQIEFGAAVGGPTDPVQMDVNGTVTFNVTGLYRIRVLMTLGNNEATDPVDIVLRPLINGVQAGHSTIYRIPAGMITNHEQEAWLPFQEDDEFEYELYIDSASAGDDAGAVKITPTLGGWADVPSAVIEVNRFVPLGA